MRDGPFPPPSLLGRSPEKNPGWPQDGPYTCQDGPYTWPLCPPIPKNMIQRCDSCGGPMSLLNDTNPFHCKCESCGRETHFLADPQPPTPSSADLVSVDVVIQWKSVRASAEEILALRQFVPQLRDRPMAEVYAAATHETARWSLGRHARFIARGIQADAARFGLNVVIESVEAEPEHCT